MGRSDRCPGSPRQAPRATICWKANEGELPVLPALRAVWRNSMDRIARYPFVGAGLTIAFWTFWAFSALALAHADVGLSRNLLPAPVNAPAAPVRTLILGRTLDGRAEYHRIPPRTSPSSFRAPGLWGIAHRRTVRIGRRVAGKPSFSPD